jgi:hypothetical protein
MRNCRKRRDTRTRNGKGNVKVQRHIALEVNLNCTREAESGFRQWFLNMYLKGKLMALTWVPEISAPRNCSARLIDLWSITIIVYIESVRKQPYKETGNERGPSRTAFN